MDFPTIHTNFWDAVIGVPVVLIVTQLIKWLFHPKKQYVPTIALAVGVLFSVFISHLIILLPDCLWDTFMDTPQLAVMPALKQRGEPLEEIRLLIHQTKNQRSIRCFLAFTTYFFCS